MVCEVNGSPKHNTTKNTDLRNYVFLSNIHEY